MTALRDGTSRRPLRLWSVRGYRAGSRVDAWRADSADTRADRAGHALATKDLDAVLCGPVIDLPQAVAAGADLVGARPGQGALFWYFAGGGATRHRRILADKEQNENPENATSMPIQRGVPVS